MNSNNISYVAWRFYILCFFVCVCVCVLLVRMIDLIFFQKKFLSHESNSRLIRVVKDNPVRGTITDRNGYILAASAPVVSVWIDPKIIKLNNLQIARIVELTGVAKDYLLKALVKTNSRFVWLRRKLSPEVGNKLKSLNIQGLYIQKEYKRFYPDKELISQVLGFNNIDGHGLEGLELVYDGWLSGKSGKHKAIFDSHAREIEIIKNFNIVANGNNIKTSIDRKLQYLAYRFLKQGVLKNKAQSGSVVILDIKTGEILAMVNSPSFNPNKILVQENKFHRNKTVTDVFEPGSTIKTFSVAAALESKSFTPFTKIDTSPGVMRVGRNLVRDEHNYGILTLADVLKHSSNVGMAKIILQLSNNNLPKLLHSFGFGEITTSGFPGERSGHLPDGLNIKPFSLATLSFGYGISVTALQLASAYAVLGNYGIKLPVSLLKREQSPAGVRVISKKTSIQLLQMLQTVLTKGGSGYAAQIPGYTVAGKTGTSWMMGNHGYRKHHYTSSFVGISPINNPRLVVAVVVSDPKAGNYYASQVAAPIFKNIMQASLRALQVNPDKLSEISHKI